MSVFAEAIAEKCDRSFLVFAVAISVAIDADPRVAVGSVDLIATGHWAIPRSRDENAEVRTVVVAWVGLGNRYVSHRNADSDAALIEFRAGGRARGEDVIFVSETDPASVTREHVHVRSTTQCTGGEGRRKIACVEVAGLVGVVRDRDHATTVVGVVRPIFSGILRANSGAVDKNDSVISGAGSDDTDVSAVMSVVDGFDAAVVNMNPCDCGTVEDRSVGIAACVEIDPLAVVRPNGGVGQEMIVGPFGDLTHADRW